MSERYANIPHLRFEVVDLGCKYNSREYPGTVHDIAKWAEELPPEDIEGLRVTICDATMLGTGGPPSRVEGQYIASAYKRQTPSQPRFGLVRLFTYKVIRLKMHDVVLVCGQRYRCNVADDMAHVMCRLKHVFFHEVGHYVLHSVWNTKRYPLRGVYAVCGQVHYKAAEYWADVYAADPGNMAEWLPALRNMR